MGIIFDEIGSTLALVAIVMCIAWWIVYFRKRIIRWFKGSEITCSGHWFEVGEIIKISGINAIPEGSYKVVSSTRDTLNIRRRSWLSRMFRGH